LTGKKCLQNCNLRGILAFLFPGVISHFAKKKLPQSHKGFLGIKKPVFFVLVGNKFKHRQRFLDQINQSFLICAMRNILLISLIFPLFSAAQNPIATGCKLNRETDPFTKEVKISTGFIPLDGGSVTIDATKAEIDFLFSIEGIDRCYDNNSVAMVFFEGTKFKLSTRNGGSMNCEGLFHFIFRNTASLPSMLTKMTTQKVNHFTFSGDNKHVSTITLSPADQQLFMSLAECLVNESKTLIK
jgi:hypothetical protein